MTLHIQDSAYLPAPFSCIADGCADMQIGTDGADEPTPAAERQWKPLGLGHPAKCQAIKMRHSMHVPRHIKHQMLLGKHPPRDA